MVVEKTTSTTVGSGWAAVYVYDTIKSKFVIVSSVYYHEESNTMAVDVEAQGMEKILDYLKLTGEEGVTNDAIILGELRVGGGG